MSDPPLYVYGDRIPKAYRGMVTQFKPGSYTRIVDKVVWVEMYVETGHDKLVLVVTDKDEWLVLDEDQLSIASRWDVKSGCVLSFTVTEARPGSSNIGRVEVAYPVVVME